MFGACLAALIMLLPGCSSGETTATAPGTITPTTPTVPSRTISGTVSYSGNVKSSHQIIIVANRMGEQTPAYSVILRNPGPFSISDVTDATYTLIAFMDLGDDMGPPGADEPSGFYDGNGDGKADVVIMTEGKGLAGIDITLTDPT